MSLNRSLLRWSIVSALSNYTDDPLPTLAGKRIFDSKIEAVENVKDKEILPMIVVYTDYDKDAIIHATTAKTTRTMTITLELLIAIISDVDPESGSYSLNYPTTDSEIEFSLDMLEAQVWRAMQASNLAADFFRSVVVSVESQISRRGATVESGNKLGARQVTWEVHVLKDPMSGVLPEYAAAFIEELKGRGEYKLLAETLEEMYSTGITGAPGLLSARHQMYSDDTADKLNMEFATPTVMVPEITWLDINGDPL